MVLGIVGLVFFPLSIILGPVAVVLGSRAKVRIAESGGALEGASMAQAGLVLGIVCCALPAVGVLVLFGNCVAMLSGG